MSAPPARGYLGISEVLAELRAEFPDISVSKIRFLETEGLIAPARSPAGYRRFCGPDLDRLRFVLTAQRDQYLPLRVIRERLARLDQLSGDPAAGTANGWASQAGRRGVSGPTDRHGAATDRASGLAGQSAPLQPAVSQSHPGRALPGNGAGGPAADPATAAGSDGMLSRRALLDAAGMTEALLTELETFGLVRRVGRHYGPDAVEVGRAAVALTAFGVEARHLRAVRAAAERESAMIESLVAPILRQRAPGARELAGRTARDCAWLVVRLHRALVEGALAEAGLAEPGVPQAGLARQDSEGHVARGVGGASA